MISSNTNPLQPLVEALRAFAHARDWEQFHTPKNLACALSVEAAELLERRFKCGCSDELR